MRSAHHSVWSYPFITAHGGWTRVNDVSCTVGHPEFQMIDCLFRPIKSFSLRLNPSRSNFLLCCLTCLFFNWRGIVLLELSSLAFSHFYHEACCIYWQSSPAISSEWRNWIWKLAVTPIRSAGNRSKERLRYGGQLGDYSGTVPNRKWPSCLRNWLAYSLSSYITGSTAGIPR